MADSSLFKEALLKKSCLHNSTSNSNLETLYKQGYKCNFADESKLRADDDCPICLLIMREPMLVVECGHSFCKTCLDDWMGSCEGPVWCPLDNLIIDQTQVVPNRHLQRMIGSLMVYCDNRDDGCDRSLELRDFDMHMEKCEYKKVHCPLLCGEMMTLWSVGYHTESQCPLKVTSPMDAQAQLMTKLEKLQAEVSLSRDMMNNMDAKFSSMFEYLQGQMSDVTNQAVYSNAKLRSEIIKAEKKHSKLARELQSEIDENYEELLNEIVEIKGQADENCGVSEIRKKIVRKRTRDVKKMKSGDPTGGAVASVATVGGNEALVKWRFNPKSIPSGMASIFQTVRSYIYKPPAEPVPVKVDAGRDSTPGDNVKENDAPELASDKKTDENIGPSNQPGMIWRLSSGLYSSATGAVGYSVDGVKWVAGKGYDAGKAVVNKVPSIPRVRKKDKNE